MTLPMPSDSPDYAGLEAKIEAYRLSISGRDNEDMFSLGYQWADKPHRHVYDLCALAKSLIAKAREADTLRAERDNLRGLLEEAQKHIAFGSGMPRQRLRAKITAALALKGTSP